MLRTGKAGVLTNCPTAAADHPHVTTYGYDELGRNISSTDGRNKTTTRAFDAAGQVIKTTKPGGVVSSLSYDAMGRVIKTVQAAGSDVERTSTTAFDIAPGSSGCPVSAAYCVISTDAVGHRTVNSYSAANRLLATVAPGGTTRLDWDRGRVARKTDPDGRPTEYSYDDAGRSIEVDYSDAATADVFYAYDALGRRAMMDDGTGSTEYEYDAASRPTAITSPEGTVRVTYDASGQMASTIYPDGSEVQRRYDPQARLASVTDWAGRTTAFSYDADGNVVETAYPNASKVTSRFDATGNLSGTAVIPTVGTGVELDLTRDEQGRLSREDQSGSAADASYAYDEMDVLTRSTRGTASHTFSTDPAGALLELGATTMAYGSDRQLRSATTAASVTNYSFSPNGERTRGVEANGHRH